MEILDLNSYKTSLRFYGGNAGQKYGIDIDGNTWIVKFPESTRSFRGQQKNNPHLPSYALSPESEYIGSHIYNLLNIPVHETFLGFRDNKIVVACRDFTENTKTLIEFKAIKNTMSDDDMVTESSDDRSGGGACLEDVLYTIENAELLQSIKGVKERFWDMFVVDAFIKNNDRNNANWGLLVDESQNVELAPVYDNGNCLFNKRNDSLAEKRLSNPESILQDVIGTNLSFYKTRDGKSIHAFDYMKSGQNRDCNEAVRRIAKRIDTTAVNSLIDEIPTTAFGLSVLTDNQKSAYKEFLKVSYEELFKIANML